MRVAASVTVSYTHLFPEHHDVRCLAQDGAQCGGECQPDGFADLHLIDAGQDIFDRILDRDDFAVGPVTSKIPSGNAINRSNVFWSSVKNPSSGRPSFKPSLSKIRITMLSP